MTDSYNSQCSKKTKDMKKLIPRYLADFKMLAKTAELRVSYDAPTDQTTYTFTLTWEDEEEQDNNTKSDESTMRSIGSTSDFTTTSSNTSISTVRAPIIPQKSVPAVIACCDGPCKRAVPSNKLNILGRCGHYLCDACYGIVTNSDGTKGCSSFSCNWHADDEWKSEEMKAYDREICELQRQRVDALKREGFKVTPASTYTSSSLLSTKTSATLLDPIDYDPSKTSSDHDTDNVRTMPLTKSSDRSVKETDCNVYPSRHEIVIAKVVLIESNQTDDTLHIHNQIEIATSINVRRVIEKMFRGKNRSFADYLNHGGRLYYVSGMSDGTKKFRRVKQEQLNNAKLYEFPIIKEYVFFVLDTIGVLRKKQFEIFLGYGE